MRGQSGDRSFQSGWAMWGLEGGGLTEDDHSVGVLLDPRQLGYRQVSGSLVSLWRALWKGQGCEVAGRTVLSQWLW